MVGKTYLRYVVGPQGGSTVSNAALSLDSSVIQPQYRSRHLLRGRTSSSPRGGKAVPASNGRHAPRSSSSPSSSSSSVSALFVPSLEAVRVLAVRSGALLHTLIPAEAKMPVEVTSLRVFPLACAGGGATGPAGTASLVTAHPHLVTEEEGWMLLVGYSNGCVGVFTCSETANYGKPVCRLYALGHRVDTNVLALAVDSSRSVACSGGQDTDVTVWDLMSQEAVYRLRGHRGGIVSLQFTPSRGGDGGGKGRGGKAGDSLLISGAADGLVKVWDLSLRQCLQTVVASDAQVTSLALDCEGRRLYCGVRESLIKVYSLDAVGKGGEGTRAAGAAATTTASVDDSLFDHGTIARKYHKPITSFSFSPDGSFLLATTSRTLEVYRVLSTEEVKRKVYRKKRRQQRPAKRNGNGNHHGGEEGAHDGSDGEEEEDAGGRKARKRPREAHQHRKRKQPHGEDKEGAEDEDNEDEAEAENENENEDPLQTASEEVTLLRTFFITSASQPGRKIRSACFVPPPARVGGGASASAAAEGEDHPLHLAVSFNDNSMQTYTTGLTLSDAVGGATWTLKDLKPRLSFDQQSHQSDIRALAFVGNDSALLSLSKEKVLMWSLTVQESRMEKDYVDQNDFHDAREANVARVDFRGTLNCCGCVLLNTVMGGGNTEAGESAGGKSKKHPATGSGTAGGGDGVAMAAVSANLCCVGLSDGTVSLLDVASSETIFAEPAFHIGGVKSITKKPDSSGFLSLGADRRLVTWTVGLLKDGRTATLLPAAEIELTELPLFASFSPDHRYLGVGLQNNNIQLFFADSLKPYLSLFGHKLPPTDMSFSSDGALVASVGTDKSLRFWGTDFGDCHRAIHAHDDYITAVEFVNATHYVFTVSLDGSVKHWDGDNWTMIQCIRQHQHGLWAVAITANATCVATAGSDKCVRCMLRTQTILFPGEEEERMGQEAMDEEVTRKAALQKLDVVDGSSGGALAMEVGVAGQQTAATAEAAERLMEALDLVSVELQRKSNPEDTSPSHPLLANTSEWEYLWSIIASIRPSELRHALASLTTVHVDALLNDLDCMLKARAVPDFEIASKIVLGLVMPSIAAGAGGASLALRSAAIHSDASELVGVKRLERLRRAITDGLDRTAGRMDYNIAGLQFICQYLEQTEKVKFFDLSKIQGHKKRFHSRLLPSSSDKQS